MSFTNELYRPHWASKTFLTQFRKCPRLAHFIHRYRRVRKHPSPILQTLWRIGRTVGTLARKTFTGGHLVYWGDTTRLSDAKIRTRFLVEKRQTPIFEGVFQWDGVVVVPDILVHDANRDAWELIEVKSTPGMRFRHLWDVGLQDYVLRHAGIRVSRVWLWTVNPRYVRRHSLDLNAFFQQHDVTSQIRTPVFEQKIEQELIEVRRIINAPSPPPADLKSECYADGGCVFFRRCWEQYSDHPALYLPFLSLPQRREMLNSNIIEPQRLSGQLAMHPQQHIQYEAFHDRRLRINRKRIRRLLEKLEWPIAVLDFEIYNLVIPVFNGTSPAQSTPFLYVATLETSPGSPQKWIHAIVNKPIPPDKQWIQQLIRFLQPARTLVVFAQDAEQRTLRGWAEQYPELAKTINSLIDRMIDIQRFIGPDGIYHADLNNSQSLKIATAVFSGHNPYQHLPIRDGFQAAFEFYRMIEEAPPDQRLLIQRHLIDYCKTDVESTLFLLRFALSQISTDAS